MKKKNNKGFLLSEALIVSTFVLTVIALIFVQLKGVMINFKKQYTYNNVENIYSLGALAEFISKNDIKFIDNKYIYESGSCKNYVTTVSATLQSTCNVIVSNIGVDYVFYTDSDIENVKTTLNDSSYSQELRDFTERIKTDEVTGRKRLIAKFTNGGFSTVIIPDRIDDTCSEVIFNRESECSATCGGGTKVKYAVDKNDTSIECPGKNETVECNTEECGSCYAPEDVELQDGTSCSASCGYGTYNRIAYSKSTHQRCPTTEYDQNSGGSSCYADVELRDGASCSASCGYGTYNRIAYSKSTGHKCPTAAYDQSSGGSSCYAGQCQTNTGRAYTPYISQMPYGNIKSTTCTYSYNPSLFSQTNTSATSCSITAYYGSGAGTIGTSCHADDIINGVRAVRLVTYQRCGTSGTWGSAGGTMCEGTNQFRCRAFDANNTLLSTSPILSVNFSWY